MKDEDQKETDQELLDYKQEPEQKSTLYNQEQQSTTLPIS